ncbi:MAG: hypothetical protein QNJ69_13990 [Gammaproteobacteria bacterium]|nr:hypothetical protein [Gammaproteobacteria bacterium]
MNPETKKTGVGLAITAATLFSIAPMNATASNGSAVNTGKCMGGNSCKGQSFCHTATHACAGQNACKGQGWIKTTSSDCNDKGGKFEVAQMEQQGQGSDYQHHGQGHMGQKHGGKQHGKKHHGKGQHGQKHGGMHGKKHHGKGHEHRKRMEERLDRIEALLQQLVDQNKAASGNN